DARDELENNTDESLKNTEEYQQQVRDINSQIGKLEDAQTELEEVNRLAGETVYDKEVQINPDPSVETLNSDLGAEQDKTVRPKLAGWALIESKLKSPVTKTVNVTTGRGFGAINRALRAYATGTDHHPGGAFIAG